jgi:hypothetical protein
MKVAHYLVNCWIERVLWIRQNESKLDKPNNNAG